MLVSLHDSADSAAITNGFFTGPVGLSWSNNGGGNYNVNVPNSTFFGCDSPSHRVRFISSGTGAPLEVALTRDVPKPWPG